MSGMWMNFMRRFVLNRGLVTALVAAPDIEPTSPLTYVGMARFYGYARHERTERWHASCSRPGPKRTMRPRTAPRCTALPATVTPMSSEGLLEAGADPELADPETPSETALRAAAAFGWPQIVDMLVAKGAKPRSVIEAAGAGDLAGYDLGALSDSQRANAFRAAAVNERLGELDRLLAAGVAVDAESDGRPAIHGRPTARARAGRPPPHRTRRNRPRGGSAVSARAKRPQVNTTYRSTSWCSLYCSMWAQRRVLERGEAARVGRGRLRAVPGWPEVHDEQPVARPCAGMQDISPVIVADSIHERGCAPVVLEQMVGITADASDRQIGHR